MTVQTENNDVVGNCSLHFNIIQKQKHIPCPSVRVAEELAESPALSILIWCMDLAPCMVISRIDIKNVPLLKVKSE